MNPGTYAAINASTAAAAAAEQQRQLQQEEEEMTSYSSQDLAGDWEFKILRSTFGAFGDSDRLREILDEEARAGWTLVEKFDNHRVRLKRSARERQNDTALEFDPYRTTFDERMPERTKKVLFGVLAFFLLCIVVGVAVGVLANF